MARSADGRLWLVSSAGVTVVDPRRLPHNALLPPVHIEQLVADRRSFASTPGSGPVELPAQVRDLQIDYTATSLVAPEKMAFRYRLEGFDQGWREAGTRRQAFYTDLPPGNYRFRVIASNNSGVWNETGATLDFSIPAAYHQAAWFRALAVAALLLAAWAAYQWRVRSLANRLAQVQQENRERLKAEEALRDSEERYALAVAGSNEGIFDWDLRTDRVYLASHTQHLIGIPPGALWRSREEWKSLVTVHPDDVGRVHSHLKAHIAGRTPAYDVEFRFVLDGVPRWFSQRAVAVRDATGKAYRMVGQIGDIHERKTQQEELKRLEGRLRQAQRFEAMGTLAGGIAHDFNNILGAILGFGERALRAAGRDGRLRTDLDQVVAASHRGRALVETIQQFSRSGAGERVSVHVEKVVREALGLLQAKLPAGTRLITTLRAGRAAIVGDPTQVHQVVMNLGTNAMHAMRRGGDLAITLDVATFDKPRPAHVGTVEPGDHVVLNVADTGSGIPPEIIERIFDPFFTTKEAGAGSGLGLSLVLRIVTELGGAIDVISTVDVGTAFTVYFPRAGDARDDDDGVADLPLARGRGQRVLIVDDEVPLATLMSETLAELGYATVTFTSSTVALEAFRADPDGFDVLIADGRMPELSGQDLLRAVRRMRGSLPTMLISGDFGAARTGGTDGGGADIVLRKPVSMRDLASALARLLETRKTTG